MTIKPYFSRSFQGMLLIRHPRVQERNLAGGRLTIRRCVSAGGPVVWRRQAAEAGVGAIDLATTAPALPGMATVRQAVGTAQSPLVGWYAAA